MSGLTPSKRILVIGPYPPPFTGWTLRIVHVQQALRQQGHQCLGLDIGPNRRVPREGCLTVANGPDYLWKICRHAASGWLFHLHLNGDSRKGFWLAAAATMVGRLFGKPPVVTFHGGPRQPFFPRPSGHAGYDRLAALIFRQAAALICNNAAVKSALESYGVPAAAIHPIPAFTRQYLDGPRLPWPEALERFAAAKRPLLMTYCEDREEYTLPALFDAVSALRDDLPELGVVFVGGKVKVPSALKDCVFLAGSVPHGLFLSLLEKAAVYVRTHLHDGVCSSVLEALALGTPVAAADDGLRPEGVVTFRGGDARDMQAKVRVALQRPRAPRGDAPDTVAEEVGLLLRYA